MDICRWYLNRVNEDDIFQESALKVPESLVSGPFRQVKEGDNTASAPWGVQWESKAKWEARFQVHFT